jgi:hypothetical protein
MAVDELAKNLYTCMTQANIESMGFDKDKI